MKIAVTGKGGVGKTTFAATLARLYAAEGRPVLAADVDPDANLGLALGFDEETLDSIVPISKMRKLVEERTGATAGNQFYHLNPKVDDIPEKYGKVCNGVRLLVLGTVETGGGGCVCPEHVMLKRIINNLVLRREDVVILDMEAGLEHLGRGTTEGVDAFIVVIEPGARSVQTYKNVKRLAKDLGIHFTCFTAASCTYHYQYCASGEDYARSRAYFIQGLQMAHELEIPYMAMNSGWGFWNEEREEAWKRSREMLWEVACEAEKLGITLTMESLRRAESQLVYRLEDAVRMEREVNHPNLKIMIDTTAMAVAGENMESWFDTFGSKICNLHFVDGTPYGHLAWGDGEADIKEILDIFDRNRFSGHFVLEYTDSKYFLEPFKVYEKTYHIIRQNL